MCVLFGALALSEREQIPVRLVWHPDWHCEACFEELFEPIESRWFKVVTGTFLDRPSSHRELYLPQVLRLPFYRKQIKLFHPERHGTLADALRKWRSLYINTGFQIAPYGAEQIKRLRPIPELQQQIDKTVATFPENIIGVHVRRSDNLWSTDVSTDEAFIEAMNRYPEAKFYIATDDTDVKWRLRETFKGRTLAQEAFSIDEAVVDLFCLAHTRRVIGSYWSSFSDMAAEISGIPLEIAGKSQNTDAQ